MSRIELSHVPPMEGPYRVPPVHRGNEREFPLPTGGIGMSGVFGHERSACCSAPERMPPAAVLGVPRFVAALDLGYPS